MQLRRPCSSSSSRVSCRSSSSSTAVARLAVQPTQQHAVQQSQLGLTAIQQRNQQQQQRQLPRASKRTASLVLQALAPAAAAAAGGPSTAAAGPAGPSAAGGGSSRVRRMILLRHADSETSTKLRDYDRPISLQGKREASNIARRLCELGWVPDLIIASNSKRTKQTLDTMAEAASELSQVSIYVCFGVQRVVGRGSWQGRSIHYGTDTNGGGSSRAEPGGCNSTSEPVCCATGLNAYACLSAHGHHG